MSCSLARWLCSLPAGALRMRSSSFCLARGSKTLVVQEKLFIILLYIKLKISGSLCLFCGVIWHLQVRRKGSDEGRVAMLWPHLIFMISAQDVGRNAWVKIPV